MKLKHALVAALALGLAAPLAQADLLPGDPLTIVGGEPGIPHWGNLFGNFHPFGSATTHQVDGLNVIAVTSDSLPPPPGKKFAGVITIDYGGASGYMFDFPHLEVVDIFGIKDPGGINFINTVETDLPFPHVITTDGFNIHFEVDSQDIATLPTPHVTITWTQSVIPAPGALALLGLAGLMGTRRRRR